MRPAIDPEVLGRVVGDDAVLIREVIEDFVPAARSGIAEIRAAAFRAVAAEVKLASHRLKGSSSLVGARALTEVCAELETAGDEGDWPTIEGLLPRLDDLMGDIEASAAASCIPRRARSNELPSAPARLRVARASAADRDPDKVADAVGDGGGGEADQELAQRRNRQAAAGEERGPPADENQSEAAGREARQ